MTYDYFYGQQADQFSFYRIPKALFTDDAFDGITTDAKLLYGIPYHRRDSSDPLFCGRLGTEMNQ